MPRGRPRLVPRKGGKPLTSTQRRQVKKMIDKEVDRGYKDTVADDTDVTWNNDPVELTAIAEGDSDTTRDGQQIQLTGLNIRINTRPGASQTVTTTCRLIVFRWMKDSAPSFNSILDLAGGIDAPASQLNLTTNKGEYQILHDKSFICAADSGSPFYHRAFKHYLKLNGTVTYSGAGSTTGIKGRLYYQFISDIVSNGPRILSSFRLRYNK